MLTRRALETGPLWTKRVGRGIKKCLRSHTKACLLSGAARARQHVIHTHKDLMTQAHSPMHAAASVSNIFLFLHVRTIKDSHTSSGQIPLPIILTSWVQAVCFKGKLD